MFDRRRLLASSVGGLAAAASSRAFAADGKVAALRFAMRGGLQPVCAMTIGKNGPYLVLLDTGDSFGPMIREELAQKLDLRPIGEARIYGAAGTDTGRGYAAHQVIFGGQFLAEDVNFMGTRSMGGLDAIAPIGLFTLHYTEMDFGLGEMRIHLSGAPDRTGFRPVPCERVRQDGAFIVDAMVDGRKARLLVDTGAATTVSLSPTFVRKYGLWDTPRPHLDSAHGGVTRGLRKMRLVKSPTFQVGPFKFQDAIIGLDDPTQASAGQFDGLLGIEMLKRFTLGFDAAGSTLWLKPNGALADPFVYDYSGLTESFEGGVARVVSVAKGSPSETVGLQPGDRLLGIDTPAKYFAFDRRLSSAPDQEIAFEIERGGQRMPIKMTLKDWL